MLHELSHRSSPSMGRRWAGFVLPMDVQSRWQSALSLLHAGSVFPWTAAGGMAVTPVNCGPRAHTKGFEGKLREEITLIFFILAPARGFGLAGLVMKPIL